MKLEYVVQPAATYEFRTKIFIKNEIKKLYRSNHKKMTAIEFFVL